MSGDFDELADRLRNAAKALAGPQMAKVLVELGVQAKKDIDDVLTSTIGGDKRMSNWKKALGSGFETIGAGVLEIRPRPVGPWRVLEEGAAAHTVAPKARRKGRKGKRQSAVMTPFGPRRVVQIPHTRALRTWTKAETKITAETPKRALDAVHKVMKEGLGL